jgi:hypothetical protein
VFPASINYYVRSGINVGPKIARSRYGDFDRKEGGCHMLKSKFKLLSLFGTLAMVALTAGGTGLARADEIVFGNITPSSGLSNTNGSGCTHAGSDPGFVCSNGQTFTAEGDTFTATGFNGQFTGATALAWKPNNTAGGVSNSLGESGLGENATGPTYPPSALTHCSDVDCEVDVSHSLEVTVTSGNSPIVDVVIGSVQPSAEVFDLFGATKGGTLTQIGGDFNSGNCPNYDGSATCTFNLSGDNFFLLGFSKNRALVVPHRIH